MQISSNLAFDLVILILGWLLGQIIFSAYEAHVPGWRRLGKFAVLTTILMCVHMVFGRASFYGCLVALTLAMAVLHGWWFHWRHGVHWRRAEPRHKYWQLIGYTPPNRWP